MRKILGFLMMSMLVIIFSGCGGGGGSSGATGAGGAGAGAKGPFKQGSTVIAYKLDNNGSRSAITANTLTTDAKGHFSFGTSLPWTGPTEFVISGEYLNENTGTYMNLPVDKGLSAIINVEEGVEKTVNINIFTDIAAKSIKASMLAGTSVADAKADAKAKVKKLFNIPGNADLEKLDLTEGTGDNAEANTQLLLVSSALLNTVNPEQTLADLGKDLADDGNINDSAVVVFDNLKSEATKVDLKKVATTLEDADIGVADAPDSSMKGVLSFDNNISFADTVNAFRSTPYTSTEAIVDDISGGSGDISIVNGTYSIDGGAFVSTAGVIANGQKLRIKTTSASAYSTTEEASVTIGGTPITYKVTTKPDPFVIDTTPDPFSFGFLKNQNLGQNDVESKPIVITGINSPATISLSDNTSMVEINGHGFQSALGLTVSNGDILKVRNATASTYGTQKKTIVTIGGVSGTFSTFTKAEDKTPDAFSFVSKKDINISTLVKSNTVTISGINSAANISIEGGDYSINGNLLFTDANGTINNGDTLTIQTTSSTNYETEKEVKVTINNSIFTFKVKTMSDPVISDSTPDEFSFATKINQELNTDVDANITVTGINTPTPVSIDGGTYVVNGGVADANVSNGDIITVTQTTSSDYNTETNTTLTIGGVSAVYKTVTRAKDVTPDDFGFDSNLSITTNTVATSNTVTITGLDDGTPISVTNGTYSLAGTAFTSSDGTINVGDTLTLRQTSASAQGTSKVTTVTIGEVSRSFTTKTIVNAPDINSSAKMSIYKNIYYDFTPSLLNSSGSIQRWSITSKPSWAEFNPLTGRLFGMPKANDVGNFNGIVIEGTNVSGDNNITFNIEVKDHTPVANDQNLTIIKNKTFRGSLNATDADANDTLVYKLVSNTDLNGTVDINSSTGAFTYVPISGFEGSNSFTYKVVDENNVSSNITTVNMDVKARIIVVTATDDLRSIAEDTNTTIDVLANDNAKYTDDNSTATGTIVSAVSTPSHGSATIVSNTIQYIPDANYNGNDSFTYTAQSISGSNDSATVTVTVTPVDDAPVAVDDTAVTIDKMTPVTINVLANDTDIDGDTLSISSVGSVSKGSVSIKSGGIQYTPNGIDSGTFSFSYTISDGHGKTDTANVQVIVDNNTSAAVTKADDILSSMDVEQGNIDENLTSARAILEAAPSTDKSAKVALAVLDFAEILNNSCINDVVDFNDTAIGVNYSDNLPKFIFGFLSSTNNSVFDLKSNPSNFTDCTKTILASAAVGLKNASDKLAEVYASDPSFVFTQGSTEISKPKADVMRATALLAASQLEYIGAHNFGIYSGNIGEVTEDVPDPSNHDQNISVTYRPIDVDPAYSWMSSYYYFAYDHSANGITYDYDTNGDGIPDGYLGTALSDSQTMLSDAKSYLSESASIAKDLNASDFNVTNQKSINDTKVLANNIYNNLQSGSGDFDINDTNASFTVDLNPLFVANGNANGAGNGIDAFDIAVNGKFTYDCNYDRYLSIINNAPTCSDGSPADIAPREVPKASNSDIDEVIKSVTMNGKTLTGDDMLMELFGNFDEVAFGYGWNKRMKDPRYWNSLISQNGSDLTLTAQFNWWGGYDTRYKVDTRDSRVEAKTRIYSNPATKVAMTFEPIQLNPENLNISAGASLKAGYWDNDKDIGIFTGINTNQNHAYIWVEFDYENGQYLYLTKDSFNRIISNEGIAVNHSYGASIEIVNNTIEYAFTNGNGTKKTLTFDFDTDVNTSVKNTYKNITGKDLSISGSAFNLVGLKARNRFYGGDQGSKDSFANATIIKVTNLKMTHQ